MPLVVVLRCILVITSRVGGTAKGIAYTLRTVGLADRVMASSSMDFASEYGFENDDAAIRLWNEALDLYNWEVNGVAG